MSALSTSFRVVASDLGFTEGPTLLSSGALVVVSVDRGIVYRLDGGGAVALLHAEGGTNGATEGADGSLYVTHFRGAWPASEGAGGTGGILVRETSGESRWLTQDPISPNDLCFGPDGLLYVSDPTRPRRRDGRLWRCDVLTGESHLLRSLDWYPNGIAFGPDDALYVASTLDGAIVRFPLVGDGLGAPEQVVTMTLGQPDGFAFDLDGNLIVAAVSFDDGPGSVQVWNPDGVLLETIRPGEAKLYTNVALSPDHVLYVTESDQGRVLAMDNFPTAGLALHPFRMT